MKFEYVTSTHAPIYKSFKLIDSPDAFNRFRERFDVIGVRWSEPTTISSSYFLKLLQDGSSAKAHNARKGYHSETDDSSMEMNEFYTTLLDHGTLWKLRNGNVICTAMPYGDKKTIIASFNQMVNTFSFPPTIQLKFLTDKYRFRANGNHMIVIFCGSLPQKASPATSDTELRNKAIQHSNSGQVRSQSTTTYVRDRYISDYAKQRANGVCQLCNTPAPFVDRDGKPYLETHHVIWLSQGGADSIENTVALCPNCHRKMHIMNLEKDVKKLLKVATNNSN